MLARGPGRLARAGVVLLRVQHVQLRAAVSSLRAQGLPMNERAFRLRPRWWLLWSPKAWRHARLAEKILNYWAARREPFTIPWR